MSTHAHHPPLDWSRTELGELLSLSNGINADKSAYGIGLPFVNVLEVITNEAMTESDIPGRITVRPEVQRRYEVKPGDVLFNRTSETQEEVGLASVYIGSQPIVFGGFVFRGRPLTDKLIPAYSKYAFRSPSVRSQIVALGQGGVRANIGQRDLKNVTVLLPPLLEQFAVADRLDDMSTLISNLQRMIAKKQAVKLGMMQQLLTGRTRFPGFTEPWRDVVLGDHVTYVKTAALSRAQLDNESPVRYLHYGDIHTRTDVGLDAGQDSMPRVQSNLVRNAGRLQVGDLVFADASEDTEGVGKSVEVVAVPKTGVVPGLHTIAARFDKAVLADGFKGYLQFVPAFRQALLRLAAGTKVLATTRSFISGITLTLPNVDEQRAIANALGDADAEIRRLRIRLGKACDVKQGMMQELLSGRIRLPVEGGVA